MAMDLVDSLESRVEARLDAAFSALRQRLRNLLARLQEEQGLVEYSAQNISDLDTAIRRIASEMDAAGLSDVAREMREAIEELRDDILKQAGSFGLPDVFSGPTERIVHRLLTQALDDLTHVFGGAQTAVEKYLSAALLGGVKKADLVEDIQRALDSTLHQAKTAAATALHSFHRQVTVTHSKENGVEEFVFTGPNEIDGWDHWEPGHVIREWCWHWTNRRATAEEFEATGNKWGHDKHPHPVMVWGGGWGPCRHHFRPVVGQLGKKHKRGPR